MIVGLLGNKSPDSNRFILVTPKPENGVRLQATLGNQNPTGLPVVVVRLSMSSILKKTKKTKTEKALENAMKLILLPKRDQKNITFKSATIFLH